jgi:ectoine hydroxylase-related dioxygenase (phytanoyl-CoA dioxygenase family)
MPGIDGDAYVVTPEQIEAFERDGYVHLPNVLTEDEMREVEEPAMRFIRGEVVPEGKDLCDMSGATDRTPDEYSVFNAMLPRRYMPSMRGNIFERRTASIATQLQRGKNMAIDYDQLLAKRPSTSDSIFAWHQDMAYWPPLEEDPSTCTCWIAIDDSTVENGCMRFLPGSGKEKELRAHAPVKLKGGDRADDESSHALCTTLTAEDETRVRLVPIKRGDITVHDERVVHGSGPNGSDGWRRAYVLAYRTKDVVDEERRLGFTHSHNDAYNWDAFHAWQEKAASA